jgi:PAS domain S-box-containing protein
VGKTDDLAFIAGGGRMGELIRGFAWESTPLGPPSSWPGSLRVMVRMLLTTRHPVFIFWGPSHLCLYNDAYSDSLGPEKHPRILGQPGRPSWLEIWPLIGPQIDMVLRGQGATWHENQLVPIVRHGELRDVYWTYSFGPIDDESAPNGVGGVLVLCTETTRQVENERRLKGELERFARLFDQAPVFMATLSGPEHRFELTNPSYTRLLGHRELIGRTVAEVVPEVVGQGYIELLDEVFRSGRPHIAIGAEFARVDPGGSVETLILDFVYQPVTGERGEITGIFVIGVDMTSRTAAQRALARSEEQLRLATEHGDIGLWDVDLVADKLFWPPRVKEMFGISSDREVSLDDFYGGLHPLDRDATAAAFAAAIDPGQRALYDVAFRTIGKEDGKTRWVAARGRGIFEAGACVRVVGTAIDITRQKRAEARLLELNEAMGRRLTDYLAERKLLADIVDGTDAFVQVADLQYRWLAINRASADEFERLFGVRPRVGERMLDMLEHLPLQRESVRSVWAKALAGEEFIEVAEFGQSGSERRFYEMHFHNLFDAAGQRIGAYQFVYDVTARIEGEQKLAVAEAALHQSQKMEAMGQLTGGIAHDFNNLLQQFRTQFELIRRKPGDSARVLQSAERGVESTRKAARLTAQLLAFSRKQPLDLKPVPLHSLVHEMRPLLTTTVGPKVALVVVLDSVPASLHVFVDATQLEMAVLNLAINARDAMPDGGEIRVAIDDDTDADFVSISVSDNGEGMNAEVASRAFDPFFTTKDAGKGSGLGLSQVYGMAQRAGGSVSLVSALGAGTTVTIRMRRVAAPAPTDAATGRAADGELHPPRRTLDILLCDDDAAVRAEVAAMLDLLGHRYVQVGSGEQALARLDGAAFDLLLVDYAMAGMDGAAVAHLARRKSPDLRIAFMSGYADVDAIEGAIGSGSVLLRKPFDLDELHGLIGRLAS